MAPEFERQCRERRIAPLPIRVIQNMANKQQLRIPRLGPHLARRHFRFREGPGCRELVRQLEEFPLADHDDGPDALEMAVRMLTWLTQSGNANLDGEWIGA